MTLSVHPVFVPGRGWYATDPVTGIEHRAASLRVMQTLLSPRVKIEGYFPRGAPPSVWSPSVAAAKRPQMIHAKTKEQRRIELERTTTCQTTDSRGSFAVAG